MTLGERMSVIRYQRGITLQELSRSTGISLGTLSNIESGYIEASPEMVELVCHGLNFCMDEFMQEDVLLARRGATQVPVFSAMSELHIAGDKAKPHGSIYVSNMLLDKGEHFIVKVSDSAMDATRIQAEDYILVKRQPFVHNHEIAVVQVGEDTPFVRSVVERENETLLYAKNFSGAYPPIVVKTTDLFHIMGKVIRVIANLRQYNTCMRLMQNEDTPMTEEMLETYGIYRPLAYTSDLG